MPLALSDPPTPADWARHTPTSDPGGLADLLAAIPPDPERIGVVDRNVIAHYRASASELPTETRDDIQLRWLADQLATDQSRHPQPLASARPIGQRVQGCCRDHTLFAVGVLRQHGVPARSRVGFAGYIDPGWHFDHVVPEFYDGARWRRFDPEISPESGLLADPLDLEIGPRAPFQTAADVYTLMRSGELDPQSYGVAPGLPFSGEQFVVGEVIYEVAHRYGDETLLWDGWGAIPDVEEPVPSAAFDLVDGVAALLLAADAGDLAAESRLYRTYLDDVRLHPGDSVTRFSPFGEPPITVSLQR